MTAIKDPLRRVGGMLVAPRATVADLSESTGRYDGVWLALAWLAAVGLVDLGDALADLRALGGLGGALGLVQGLWPLLPWLLASTAVEWLLGASRAHRAALCLVPMLVIGGAAHLLAAVVAVPAYVPAALGAAAALALAAYVRPAIATKDMSPGTGRPRLAMIDMIAGALVTALVLVSAGRDLTRLVRAWPTLAPASAGDPLPVFTAPLLDGGVLRSADLPGRPHLLIFWTTWCGVCRSEMPMYRELAARHPGVQVIAVNADRDGDAAAVRAYRDTHALPFPIALDDGTMTRGFRVRMYPHLVLVDGQGQLRGVYQGRSFASTLDAAIMRLTQKGAGP
ncbi:MAG TPA: TlpA disulfide reductase family protein [Nannocystis sp.]